MRKKPRVNCFSKKMLMLQSLCPFQQIETFWILNNRDSFWDNGQKNVRTPENIFGLDFKTAFLSAGERFEKLIVYRIMCTILQKLLKLDVFHHFWTLSDDFFNLCREKLRRLFFWSNKLELLIFFSIWKKKDHFFQQTLLNSEVTTAYHLSRRKLWDFFPEITFLIYHFWNSTGSLSDYPGKKFGVGEMFQHFSQILAAGVSELKTICPFRQFETLEE